MFSQSSESELTCCIKVTETEVIIWLCRFSGGQRRGEPTTGSLQRTRDDHLQGRGTSLQSCKSSRQFTSGRRCKANPASNIDALSLLSLCFDFACLFQTWYVGGSITQWLAYLLPDPAARVWFPVFLHFFYFAEVLFRGKWLENVDRTHLVLTSVKPVVQ